MPKFSANLSMLFGEVGFLDRFGRASNAGFKSVDSMFPYEWPKEQLADGLKSHSLEQVLFNLPAGDWAGGERGIACIPGREGEFKDGVREGHGIQHFPDGKIYEGEFINNKPHGQGIETHLSGKKYEGEFRNGKFNERETSTISKVIDQIND